MAKIRPYVAGEQPQDKTYIKLNTNENPWPPSPLVIERLKQAIETGLHLYPDPNSTALREKLAAYYGFNVDNIFVGNGSDEVLAHAFKAFFQQDLPIYFPDISYSFYPVFSEYFAIDHKAVAVNAELQIDLQDYPEKNGGIIFPNPNAPTGHYLQTNEIVALLERNRESVVIVDEAYIDFAQESALSLCKQFDNLLVTQTLSKSRSLAGMRVGFAIGNENLIAALQRVKDSFNSYPLDKLATAAAIAAYDDDDYFRECCEKIIQTRNWTTTELEQLGFTIFPSQANFILTQPPKLNAEDYYLALKEHGILVRYFKSERINKFVRITIGTQEEMQALVEASRKILGK